MTELEENSPSVTSDQPNAGRIGRRAVLGGALAAGSVAVAYAALGDKLGLLGSSAETTVSTPGDTVAIKDENVQISHLLRRAGFGTTREEFDRYQAIGLEATLQELLNYESIDDSAAVDLAAQVAIEPGTRSLPTAWWLVRIANTKRPLQEKMTVFWHGLLTSQFSEVKDAGAMVRQNEFFRSHAMDRFPDILKGISRDPAMMVYLDIAGSSRRAPNENYSRELMELFALGVGNYTEDDVREGARAFTGWRVPRNRVDAVLYTLEEPVFQPQLFDNGTKTFLGQTGNFGPDDIVDIVTTQPASAQYIVRRLFAFFVFPDPTDEEIKPFVQVYEANDMRIGAVVEAMLRSEVFYSEKAYRAIVKSPTEYAVSAAKALGLQATIGSLFGGGLARAQGATQLGSMGQVLFEPPNVAGWPGGTNWLNSSTMFARLNLLNGLTGGASLANQTARRQQPAQRQQPTPTPPPATTTVATAEQTLAHYLPFVLDDNVPADTRQVYLDYAGDPAATLSADKLRGLVYLVLGSPQFHLS